MNNHEQIDSTSDEVPEFIPRENIEIEGDKEWHVKEENLNGI